MQIANKRNMTKKEKPKWNAVKKANTEQSERVREREREVDTNTRAYALQWGKGNQLPKVNNRKCNALEVNVPVFALYAQYSVCLCVCRCICMQMPCVFVVEPLRAWEHITKVLFACHQCSRLTPIYSLMTFSSFVCIHNDTTECLRCA